MEHFPRHQPGHVHIRVPAAQRPAGDVSAAAARTAARAVAALAFVLVAGCAAPLPMEPAATIASEVSADPHMAGLAARGSIGRSMDEDDRRQVAQILETIPVGTATRWQNPETSYRFAVVPVRAYRTDVGRCREYQVDRIGAGGRSEQVLNRACRRMNGDWRLTE
jgi:surface antigen